jgi:DNA-binding transcriptional ArsR family regulator
MPAVSRSGTVPTNLDTVFGALAHPTRRAILRRLRQGPASVTELMAPFGVSQQAISRHVAVLSKAGLIHQRKYGRESRCMLRARPLKEISRWIEAYREVWEHRFERLEAYLSSTGHGSSPR